MTDDPTAVLAIGSILAKCATLGYIHSNETPRASACMRTQRGSFFSFPSNYKGPTP